MTDKRYITNTELNKLRTDMYKYALDTLNLDQQGASKYVSEHCDAFVTQEMVEAEMEKKA